MKHLLRDDDLSAGQQLDLIERALQLRTDPHGRGLAERSVALVFEKASTRTRMSFEVGIAQLGGTAVALDATTSHLARGETLGDTARVMSRYVDAIVMRTFGDARLRELADASPVPVVNALTDGFHPCQFLADLMTIMEEFQTVRGRVIAYVGDGGNNMARSYLLGGATAGGHVRIAAPPGYLPNETVTEQASLLAASAGGSVRVLTDPAAAVAGADVVATDSWVSMGQRHRDQRLSDLQPYQLNQDLLSGAASHAIVLHCLPAHRGEEITDQVMDGPASRVFDQAENRLHVQKALLTWLMDDKVGALKP